MPVSIITPMSFLLAVAYIQVGLGGSLGPVNWGALSGGKLGLAYLIPAIIVQGN
jgi:hypothetical protein